MAAHSTLVAPRTFRVLWIGLDDQNTSAEGFCTTTVQRTSADYSAAPLCAPDEVREPATVYRITPVRVATG